MTIRRFVAAKSQLAILKVREELQPNARILSVRKIEDGVEVLVEGELLNAPLHEPPFESLNDAPRVDIKTRT